MDEEIYYRGGRGSEIGDEVTVDPASLNLDMLPINLAMSGWSVAVGYPEEDGGEISLNLTDMGGSDGKTATELALSLGIVDKETGQLLPGYTVSDEGGKIVVSYTGTANLGFAGFVKTLSEMSPFNY